MQQLILSKIPYNTITKQGNAISTASKFVAPTALGAMGLIGGNYATEMMFGNRDADQSNTEKAKKAIFPILGTLTGILAGRKLNKIISRS